MILATSATAKSLRWNTLPLGTARFRTGTNAHNTISAISHAPQPVRVIKGFFAGKRNLEVISRALQTSNKGKRSEAHSRNTAEPA
jgi:hypothetical protein